MAITSLVPELDLVPWGLSPGAPQDLERTGWNLPPHHHDFQTRAGSSETCPQGWGAFSHLYPDLGSGPRSLPRVVTMEETGQGEGLWEVESEQTGGEDPELRPDGALGGAPPTWGHRDLRTPCPDIPELASGPPPPTSDCDTECGPGMAIVAGGEEMDRGLVCTGDASRMGRRNGFRKPDL